MDPTQEIPTLKPAFEDDNVALAFASDANYVPYLAATLRSVLDHCSPEHNYDLVVLSQNISPDDQWQIRAMTGGAANVSLRFIDVSAQVEKKAGDFFTSAHISIATYYRLFTPGIFALYPKLLYLDVDLVALSDVAELFHTDLEGAMAGAARDYLAIKDLPRKGNAGWREQLGLKDPTSYFNAGVMLMDLEQMRRDNYEQKWFDLLARLKHPRLHDQDILNSSCQGRIKYVDGAWNSLAWAEACGETIFSEELSTGLYREYVESLKAPKILHYLSRHKPWNLPHLDLADLFWDCARRTPYYERLIFNNLRQLNAENDVFKARLRIPPAKLKYWFYVLMSLVTSGSTRSKYKSKAFRSRKLNRGLKSILRSWH
jgi:Lipopolysaccharide biosynthesis proteins, LPS:glycosyltransferases